MLPPARCRTGKAPPVQWLARRAVTSQLPLLWKLTFVPPTKMPPRAPFGPSVVLTAGTFFSGIAFVLQKSAAASRDTCRMSILLVLQNGTAAQQTFSSVVKVASLDFASVLASFGGPLCWIGVSGGENSVSGVELVSMLPT